MSSPKGGNSLDYWVVKLNAQREIEWDNSYGDISDEYLMDVISTGIEGYVLLGMMSYNQGFIVGIDSTGTEKWMKSWGGPGSAGNTTQLYSIAQANKGGLLVLGIAVENREFRLTKLSPCPAEIKLNKEICIGDSYDFNGRILTEAGVYYDTIGGGCPNYIELTLTINSLPVPAIIQSGNSLSTDTYASYQWILDSSPLNYGKGQTLITERSGDYTIIVTDTNGCQSDTGEAFKFLYNGCEAPVAEWSKLYGGTKADQAYSVVAVAEGGYLVAGRTNSTDGDIDGLHGTAYDLWLVRVNDQGDTLWTRTYGSGGNEYMYDMIVTSDGGFALVGESATNAVTGDVTADRPSSSSGRDLWVLKLNGNGDIEWQRLYGGSNIDIGYGIAEAPDGYILCGALHNSSSGGTLGDHASNGGYDGWILKLDDQGNLLWQKRLGGGGADYLYSVVSTSDGGIAAIGYSASNASAGTLGETPRPAEDSGSDIWIVKLDAAGETVWQHLYGGSGTDIAYALALTPDGYIVSGYSASSDGTFEGKSKPGGNDAALLRLSSDGALVWSGLYGGSADDRAVSYDILVEPDGYVLSGYSASVDGDVTGNKGNTDAWVLKADLTGSLIWQRSLGGSGADQAYSVTSAAEGGYIIAGYATNLPEGKGGADFYIAKLSGCRTCTTPTYTSICEGKTYEFNGKNITDAGIYADTITTGECHIIQALDLKINPVYAVSTTAAFCEGEVYTYLGTSYTKDGTYELPLQTWQGCDSIVTLTLSYHTTTQPVITASGDQLSTGVYSRYEWQLEGDLTGETTQSVTAKKSGNYKVVVEDANGCTDTSEVYTHILTGLQYNLSAHGIEVYPNPVNRDLTVRFSSSGNYEIRLSSIQGIELERLSATGTLQTDLSDLPEGIYILKIYENEELKGIQKILKQ